MQIILQKAKKRNAILNIQVWVWYTLCFLQILLHSFKLAQNVMYSPSTYSEEAEILSPGRGEGTLWPVCGLWVSFLSQGPGKNSACMTLPKAAEWNPLELHLSREVCVFSLPLKVLSWIWGSPEATRWRGIAHIAGRAWNYVPGLLRAAHKPLALKTRIDCCLAHVLLEEVPENRGPFRSLKAGVWVCVGTKNLSEGV